MLSEQELREIDARCRAATESPWMVTLDTDGGMRLACHTVRAVRISPDYYPKEMQRRATEFEIIDEDGYFLPSAIADVSSSRLQTADFIANAIDDVPKLLDTIRELKRQIADQTEKRV